MGNIERGLFNLRKDHSQIKPKFLGLGQTEHTKIGMSLIDGNWFDWGIFLPHIASWQGGQVDEAGKLPVEVYLREPIVLATPLQISKIDSTADDFIRNIKFMVDPQTHHKILHEMPSDAFRAGMIMRRLAYRADPDNPFGVVLPSNIRFLDGANALFSLPLEDLPPLNLNLWVPPVIEDIATHHNHMNGKTYYQSAFDMRPVGSNKTTEISFKGVPSLSHSP